MSNREVESEGHEEQYRAVIDGGYPEDELVGLCQEARNARAVRKMKVGPSESSYRRRLQTAMSCCKSKAVVVNVMEKA